MSKISDFNTAIEIVTSSLAADSNNLSKVADGDDIKAYHSTAAKILKAKVETGLCMVEKTEDERTFNIHLCEMDYDVLSDLIKITKRKAPLIESVIVRTFEGKAVDFGWVHGKHGIYPRQRP